MKPRIARLLAASRLIPSAFAIAGLISVALASLPSSSVPATSSAAPDKAGAGPAPSPQNLEVDPKLKYLRLDLGENQSTELVEIPAGKFLMGSPASEEGHLRDEAQHEVTLTKPFYMGVTLVTVDQFSAFVKVSKYKTDAEKAGSVNDYEIIDGRAGTIKRKGRDWKHPKVEQTGNHPAVCISWNDATAFCDWLAKKSQRKIQLPTEAQWEFAARAGTATAYVWGNDPDDGKGWANLADKTFDEQVFRNGTTFLIAGIFSWDDGFLYTSPVASFKPNAFGLFDMAGNARQWCQDDWQDFAPQPVTDPLIRSKLNRPVQRGSSWYSAGQNARVAYRGWRPKDDGTSLDGFRISMAE